MSATTERENAPIYCGDCKHPAHSGPCPVLHFYDRPGGPPGNQQCMCGHEWSEPTITITPCQNCAALERELAEARQQKDKLEAERSELWNQRDAAFASWQPLTEWDNLRKERDEWKQRWVDVGRRLTEDDQASAD